jgi:hypothetical protein
MKTQLFDLASNRIASIAGVASLTVGRKRIGIRFIDGAVACVARTDVNPSRFAFSYPNASSIDQTVQGPTHGALMTSDEVIQNVSRIAAVAEREGQRA